jgi:hypothetical protein
MKKRIFTTIALILTAFFLTNTNLLKKVHAQPLPTPVVVSCGNIYTDVFDALGNSIIIHACTCEEFSEINRSGTGLEITYCCGWWHAGNCNATKPTGPIVTTPTPTVPGSIIVPPVDEDLLNSLNPLKNYSTKADQLSTPGGIISEVLTYSFPIAGVILFVMLIMAGLKMLTGASNSSSMEEGKKMISTAIVGFIILFAAYWIAQLIEIIFGIRILGIRQLN